jgi:general secretion pathway protein F
VSKSISLDDLAALNDEIAGLVRAGVPLEMGLASWGRDVSGQLGRVVTRLSEAVARGQTLPQSLAEARGEIPDVYHALVTAGLKSGNLPAALESLSASARNLKDVRGAVTLAVLYPLALVVIGYFLFCLLLGTVFPALMLLYDGSPPKFLSSLAGFAKSADVGIPIPGTQRVIPLVIVPPLVLVFAAVFAWIRTRRASMLDAAAGAGFLSWIPAAGRAVRHARAASFAEIMALLIEHGVPLHEALTLAAECTSDQRLVRSAKARAASLERGGAMAENGRSLAGFPPLVAWLIASGAPQPALAALARHVADTYRRGIARDARWLRDHLPMWLVVLVGGSIVLLFGLTMLVPFANLLEALGGKVGQSMRIQ